MDFHEQCLESLKEEPINLHTVPAMNGHIGVARCNGFRAGTSEFVSYVDDDDYIVPGIFKKCYQVLDENPNAIGVVTQEQVLKGDKLIPPVVLPTDKKWQEFVKYMHHLVVFRREAVRPYTERMKNYAWGSEYTLLIELLSDGHEFAILNEVGYIWRLHEHSAHKRMGATEEQRDYLQRLVRSQG